MAIPIRDSVKVLLLNHENKLLLMCAEDSSTRSANGEYYGRFWCPIGGKIEGSESLIEAATREIYEETGIKAIDLNFGPTVWVGSFDLILGGSLVRNNQTFIVAKTKTSSISLDHLTDEEKAIVKDVSWFSLDEIKQSNEVIYPIVLPDYLPSILSGNYPEKPLEIDLAKLPDKPSCS